MSRNTVVAIYGGTFSPPHLGHLRAAEAFFESVRPDRLLIIPSATPPHKAPVSGATDENRLAMCRLAFASIPAAEVTDMEIRRAGKSYTVETLRELSGDSVSLVMLVGTDMFLTLDTWYLANEIFSLAEIAVVRREDDPISERRITEKVLEYQTRFGAHIRRIDCEATVVSSSFLRERIVKGLPNDAYLAPEVEEYIRKWHLYQA